MALSRLDDLNQTRCSRRRRPYRGAALFLNSTVPRKIISPISLFVRRRRAPGLIQSANAKGEVHLAARRARDLQRFIGDVEGEDRFLFSLQERHDIDPFASSQG
jgi:hypothetical protein